MRVHDASTREHVEHGVGREQRARILEQPRAIRRVRTDEPQVVGVTLVGRMQVLGQHPLVVGRDRQRGSEEVGDEALREHHEAFVGFVGRGEVRRLHLGRDLRGLRLGHLELRVGVPGVTRGPHARRGDEPALEHLEARIGREQLVQCRRSRPGHPRDHERSAQRCGTTVGPLLPSLLGVEATDEGTERGERSELPAVFVGTGNFVERVEEPS